LILLIRRSQNLLTSLQTLCLQYLHPELSEEYIAVSLLFFNLETNKILQMLSICILFFS